MKWDAKDRRYEDDNGRPLTPAKIKRHIQEFIETQQAEIQAQAEKLTRDELSVADFFTFMRHKITALHQVTGTIAYGGEAQLNRERQRRINEKILSELQYLNQFEEQMEQSFTTVDEIIEKVVQNAKTVQV